MCYIILNLLIILYLSDFISVFLLHCLLAPARGVFAITVPGGVEATIGQARSLVLLATSRLSPVCLVLDLPLMALYLHSYGMCVFFP